MSIARPTISQSVLSISRTCLSASIACAPTSTRYVLDSAFKARHASLLSSNKLDDCKRSTSRSTYVNKNIFGILIWKKKTFFEFLIRRIELRTRKGSRETVTGGWFINEKRNSLHFDSTYWLPVWVYLIYLIIIKTLTVSAPVGWFPGGGAPRTDFSPLLKYSIFYEYFFDNRSKCKLHVTRRRHFER